MQDDANKVMVKPLRSFLGEEGDIVAGGPAFAVTRQRAADLKANGLVEDDATPKSAPSHEGKKSAAPENKQAPEPDNKAAPTHDDKSGNHRRQK